MGQVDIFELLPTLNTKRLACPPLPFKVSDPFIIPVHKLPKNIPPFGGASRHPTRLAHWTENTYAFSGPRVVIC